ncbi:YHYH domain-containing protein [Paenibacillus terrigena]|uniref:YHYH domain-containing protein n=1 Tax=Paenibacillus terrigena TaxID=369333 RepID=UPI0028D86148|nr:YHYH domain-containing protein [Paenibacillus terrigena]
MKKLVSAILIVTLLAAIPLSASAHSGRLDKNGGHNCSAKSKKKGLCTGYHYHRKIIHMTALNRYQLPDSSIARL